MLNYLKVGFIGAGNLAQAMIQSLIESKTVAPERLWVSNRTPGKLLKLKDAFQVNIAQTNEELVEKVELVVIAVKPQDLAAAIEPISSIFDKTHIVLSLAAGVELKELRKFIPEARLVRAMPNTPSVIGRGVVGYCLSMDSDASVQPVIEDFLRPFGYVLKVNEGDEMDTLMVSCSCGTGFVFELMSYWQEWIEERGFEPIIARRMTVETFLGSSMLAATQREVTLEDLATKVASKKGVTAAGLESMRELELARGLRLSFEKSWMRNQELVKTKK
jgi:pyrroline-5-carboxylate reductase